MSWRLGNVYRFISSPFPRKHSRIKPILGEERHICEKFARITVAIFDKEEDVERLLLYQSEVILNL